MDRDPADADQANAHFQDVLRQRASAILLDRVNAVTASTVAVLPYAGVEPLDSEHCDRVGLLLTQLLTAPGASTHGVVSSPICIVSWSNDRCRRSSCSRSRF